MSLICMADMKLRTGKAINGHKQHEKMLVQNIRNLSFQNYSATVQQELSEFCCLLPFNFTKRPTCPWKLTWKKILTCFKSFRNLTNDSQTQPDALADRTSTNRSKSLLATPKHIKRIYSRGNRETMPTNKFCRGECPTWWWTSVISSNWASVLGGSQTSGNTTLFSQDPFWVHFSHQ